MNLPGFFMAMCGHKRGRLITAAVLLSILGTLFLMHGENSSYLTSFGSGSGRPLHSSLTSPGLTLYDKHDYSRTIHLLIPVTAPNDKFCKTFFSSIINGFPPAFLINYNQTYWQPAIARAMKIKGFHEYLSQRTRPEDIVILVDGFDVWFQLPLQVLISRFLAMNIPVVFGADKKCWPNDFKSVACTAIPESPLPRDVFGEDTDQLTIKRSRKDKYDNFRPRWVNSGTIIGYASHVKSIYEEAWKKVEAAGEVNSDQLILAEVYGDRVVRGDMSMTVDFYSTLFQTMTYSHSDIGFIKDPSEDITSTTFSVEVSKQKLDLEDLGLSKTKSPGWARSPWRTRNLAWNKVSNVIPTCLHFNGPKNFIDIWWPRMWFYQDGVKWKEQITEERRRAGAWVEGREPGQLGWFTYESLCGREKLFGEP